MYRKLKTQKQKQQNSKNITTTAGSQWYETYFSWKQHVLTLVHMKWKRGTVERFLQI